MSRIDPHTLVTSLCLVLSAALTLHADEPENAEPDRPGLVRCANLIYGANQSSKCFADHFMADTQNDTNIWTVKEFSPVRAESEDLFRFPFAVMSGEGSFELTEDQSRNLRRYLTGGGFLVVSPGCSSPLFASSFESQIARVLPSAELKELPPEHPIFHTVYEIDAIKTKKQGVKAVLKAITLEGRVVLVYSPEGLNDTGNAGGSCCCCGGNEVLNARQVNVNLLAYALTH